ncbi:NfeD family protein [Novosphingobium sp. EMRT-2]|uniref:NfeD family protein n=1 Tax=Novosphingobium sp. EMRT-2 TaxID=2571749 RepID=UPI0010BDC84C|nr:NfeD family protein [Novosphingobium sp. EMRT-2]QCI94547.1 NfeD family protein [Novosphingobium sp. EMRT-2]
MLDALAPHWGWLALGVALAIAELVAPGYFLIWLAAAALLTGFVAAALPVALAAQVVLFAVLAGCVLFAGRRWLARNPVVSADPLLNDRGGRLIGQSVTVVQAIEGGGGRVRQGDTEWLVRGPDAPVGARMRVAGHDGAVLIVEFPD